MSTFAPLQDSGPQEVPLLSHLLQAEALVLDERDDVAFATPGACELFGVADLEVLRKHWSALRAQLRIADWPEAMSVDATHCGRADVSTPAGLRAIRFEVHPWAGARAHRAVLVRDRARLLPSDGALLLASEALANRYVLTGLAHIAKGPLNNFQLTLALLAAGAGRADAVPDVFARRKGHVDVLQSEIARLSACIDEIHALTLPHDPSRGPVDLAAISRDCARTLRHGATMREVRLELDAPDEPVIAQGDEQLVRLALLSLAICMIELTSSGGRVGWRVAADAEAPSIVFRTTEPALPPRLRGALFRLSCATELEYAAAIAARLVIEAQRGDVILHEAEASPAIVIRIPARD